MNRLSARMFATNTFTNLQDLFIMRMNHLNPQRGSGVKTIREINDEASKLYRKHKRDKNGQDRAGDDEHDTDDDEEDDDEEEDDEEEDDDDSNTVQNHLDYELTYAACASEVSNFTGTEHQISSMRPYALVANCDYSEYFFSKSMEYDFPSNPFKFDMLNKNNCMCASFSFNNSIMVI